MKLDTNVSTFVWKFDDRHSWTLYRENVLGRTCGWVTVCMRDDGTVAGFSVWKNDPDGTSQLGYRPLLSEAKKFLEQEVYKGV